MADINMQEIQALIDNSAIASAINNMAMRPQKTYVRTIGTPYALNDMLAARNTLGEATRRLDQGLKPRESYLYSLGSALAAMPQQQGPGSWLSALARGFGAGATARTNALTDRVQKTYDAQMKDLATRLAYDKAMGDVQEQIMGYTPMEYSTGAAGGKGAGAGTTATQKPKNYDFSAPEMPEKPAEWGELEIQATGRVNPDTGVRTGGGIFANIVAEKTNPQGLDAMSANQTAYAKTFTTDRIAEIAQAAGGSRGIDTMPEVTLKGGPELSANNMNSRRYSEAVQNRAWDIADQIIKANPNATITREELANAFINDFNHSLRKDFRVVQPVQGERATKQNQQYQPGQIVQAKDGKLWKFKGGDRYDKNNWEAIK